ncbi:helix-turn-helix domain-containing protein [Cohnella ginsengisoli]|uniref:Helix-turn-helix domain-containing protein n=1 Tax=Cohnella ginsengisoli TaxID=425004 RepID=A0A9X4KLE1_9BACL|nr:helix-turn-helix domain-containing protein [Cohnella ginsengisoli]MDG0794035.1 helix-turn-helix domain-containing protein [Cohnella ginsengisoli]
MPESKADLILHPIRMRIIQSLIGGVQRTTQQIAELLTDIPQATLYRHLNKLRQAQLIEIVDQHQVRGTMEKVYRLAEHGADVPADDLKTMTPGQHMELFMKFIATLIGEYGRYLQQENFDLVRDGVSMRQVELYLTDEEYMQLLADMRAPLLRHSLNEPLEGRRRRNIATIVIPGANMSAAPANRTKEQDDHE